METDSGLKATRGWGRRESGAMALRYTGFQSGKIKKVLDMDGSDGGTTMMLENG